MNATCARCRKWHGCRHPVVDATAFVQPVAAATRDVGEPGLRFARSAGPLRGTDTCACRLLRGCVGNLTLPSGLVSIGWTAASLLPALDYSFIASKVLGEHSFLSVYMSDENAVQPAGALNSSPNRNFVVDCATRVSHPDRACLVELVSIPNGNVAVR